MFTEKLIYLLLTYKYPLLIPLALVEGHIVSVASGVLAHTGQINPFLAFLCIIAGNLIGDISLYWIGYYKGDKFVRRWGKYIGVDEAKFAKGHEFFNTHKTPILLISKLTNGFGLAIAVLLTAGAMRIKFSTYMFWNVIGECIWTAGLICVGYFLGNVYTAVDNVILRIGMIAGIIVVVALIFLHLRKKIKKKLGA